MAYVRYTDTLVREIVATVHQMSKTAQAPYLTDSLQKSTREYDDLCLSVERVAWGKYADLKDKMPSSWVAQTKAVDVVVPVPDAVKDAHPDHEFSTLTVTLAFEGDKKFTLTPEFNTSRRYYNNPTVDFTQSDVPASMVDWYTQKATKDAEREALKKKFKTIADQLKTYMESHGSLNTALRDMPQLEHYVPDHYMAKFRGPEKKREKKAPRTDVADIGIDISEITTAAVAHRFASANSA